MINRATAEMLYAHFGRIASEIAEAGDEVQPQMFFIHMKGDSFDYSVFDPDAVRLLHSHPLGKDIMAVLIRATLLNEGPLIEKLPKPVDAIVHISEAWAIERKVPTPDVAPAEAPDRKEMLLVTVHSPDRSRMGMSPITKAGPNGRHIDLVPLPSDLDIITGRFVLGNEQQPPSQVH